MPVVLRPKIIRSKRRSLSLQILPDATITVKAPFHASDRVIEGFIQQHAEWIEKRIELVKQHGFQQKRSYINGEMFLYLGKKYVLEIGSYPEIAIRGEKLLFPQALRFRIQQELVVWYKKQAREVISERVAWYAKQMETAYTDLTFSDTKSQWGSCSHDNRLQFSWRLVMVSLLTINYVVVHELAHTLEKNHSRSFWAKVRLYNPSYKHQIQWLKIHGHSLVI